MIGLGSVWDRFGFQFGFQFGLESMDQLEKIDWEIKAVDLDSIPIQSRSIPFDPVRSGNASMRSFHGFVLIRVDSFEAF